MCHVVNSNIYRCSPLSLLVFLWTTIFLVFKQDFFYSREFSQNEPFLDTFGGSRLSRPSLEIAYKRLILSFLEGRDNLDPPALKHFSKSLSLGFWEGRDNLDPLCKKSKEVSF